MNAVVGGVGAGAAAGAGTGTDDLGKGPRTALARSGSRAVVVGTGTHVEGSGLAGIPAVAATVAAVRETLRDRCGMDPSRIMTLTDPGNPARFLDAVNRAATRAEDVLLLYYVGHGLVSLENELFLATSATTDVEVMLPVEALAFAAVRRAVSASPARHVVVVLDCCFSGSASGVLNAAVADRFELTNDRSSYLLCATPPNEQALAPDGERYTAFSGALVEFLVSGDPVAPYELTLDHVYRHLTRALPSRGAPAPQRRVGADAGGLVVAVNPQAALLTRPRSSLSGRLESPLASAAPLVCPYPGLDAFTAADARYFHGRERLVDEILRVLQDQRTDSRGGPLAIVGRSGAGKSSLLQAGLLPAIRDGRLEVPGSRHWRQVVLTPGEHPLRVLDRWQAAAGSGARDAIVCVDQFEEVFTTCSDEAERSAFISALCAAAAGDGNGPGEGGEGTPRVRVILGLRADFYGRCLDYPELAAMMAASGQIPVRPMGHRELLSAIEKPARAAGLRLEEGLAGRLLRDLESAEDPERDVASALPLLAFALQATWQQSDKRVLTLSDYEATGGIWGAVTQRAEEVYERLGPAQDAARILLLSMIQLGDGTDDVRRRVAIADLFAGRRDDERDAITKALNAYVAARLVTVDDDTAEIAHEALLRAWPRLYRWIEADREQLLERQRLAEAARMWKTGGGPLYTGARLEETRKRLAEEDDRRRRPLSTLEQEFVRSGVRAARRRRNRRLSLLSAAIAVVLVVVTGGLYAVQQRTGNQQSQAVQSSVQLAQEADSLRTDDPAGALWLSLTAYHSYPAPQARTALYDSYRTPYPLVLPDRGKGAVVSAVYSPDGRTAAASWADGNVRLWNVQDPAHPEPAGAADPGPGSALAYSPDGTILAVRDRQSLQLWKAAGPLSVLSSIPLVPSAPGSGGRDWPVAFSPKAGTVATEDGDGVVALWDAADPSRPAPLVSLPALGAAVDAIAFSPDATMLAVVGGGQVRLWNTGIAAGAGVGRPSLRASLSAPSSALSVAFSPDGRILAVGGSHEQVSLWSTAQPGAATVAAVNEDVSNPEGEIDSIAFRPGDDGVFVTTDTAGQTEIWAEAGPGATPSAESDGLPDAAQPDSAAFSPDGTRLVTGDLGGTAELWIVPAPMLTGSVDTSQTTNGVSPINGNGTLLVTDEEDGAGEPVELWDVADPAHPSLEAELPGWAAGGFLPDGRTLYTGDGDGIQLWDVADPRHPQARASIPVVSASESEGADSSWAAGDGRLLIWDPNGPSVQLWDITDISRPVLDATLEPAQPPTIGQGPEVLAYFSGDLAGITVGGDMQLWNVSDPRHPVREGEMPFDPDASWIDPPSEGMLVTGDPLVQSAVWNLASPSAPAKWVNTLGLDARTGGWINDHTLAGFTSNDDSLVLWDVRYPAPPVAQVVLPLPGGYQAGAGTSIASSTGGELLAAGISTSQGMNDGDVEVWQAAPDDASLSEYAEVAGGGQALAPDGEFVAVDLDTDLAGYAEDELNAFADEPLPNGTIGLVYPLDTDDVYTQLCSLASQNPVSSSWREYLPETFYRPACS